jgi:predicted O-methyltransferase YrrM
VQAVRESPTRPLAPLGRWVADGRLLEDAPAVRAAVAHAEHLRATLADTVRPTFFRTGLRTMHANDAVDRLSSPAPGCALLAHLVERAAPTWTVEIGSAFGVASVAIAVTLASNAEARFDGIELEDWKASIADAAVRAVLGGRARVHGGPAEGLLPALVERRDTPIDFAFVDALHTYDATWAEHRVLAAATAPGAIVVYDDVWWSNDMHRCWEAIARGPDVTDAMLVAGRWGVVRYIGAARRPAGLSAGLS